MSRRPQPWLRQGRGWYVQHNGKQVALGRDKKRAFQKYHELMSRPRATHRVAPAGDAFITVCDAFLDWTQKNRAPLTYRWYCDRLQSFVDHLQLTSREIRIGEVQPFHVLQWLDAHPNWGDTTRRASIIAAQRVFRWAEKVGYIERNPLRTLEKPAAESRDRVISSAEYRAILACFTDAPFRDLLITAWETGCRPQELLRVEARHFDSAHARWVLPPKEAKGKRRPRIVYLTETALEITSRLAKQWPTGPIFRNRNGRAWSPYSVNCRFTRLKAKLGTKYCLYHFRHSFATRLLESGLDALTVALLLGHANPTMLSTTYQHLAHNPQHLLGQVRAAATSYASASAPTAAP